MSARAWERRRFNKQFDRGIRWLSRHPEAAWYAAPLRKQHVVIIVFRGVV